MLRAVNGSSREYLTGSKKHVYTGRGEEGCWEGRRGGDGHGEGWEECVGRDERGDGCTVYTAL